MSWALENRLVVPFRNRWNGPPDGGGIISKGLEEDPRTMDGIKCEADPRGHPKGGLKQCIQHAQAPGSQAMAPGEGSGQPKCKRNANIAAAGFILGEEWARMSLGIRPQFKCQLYP